MKRILVIAILIFTSYFGFSDSMYSIENILGGWNLGKPANTHSVPCLDGYEYLGNANTVFFYYKPKTSTVYLNNIRISNIVGQYPLIELQTVFPLDPPYESLTINFSMKVHFISYDSFWLEIITDGLTKKEIETMMPWMRTWMKSGNSNIYYRAKKTGKTVSGK